MTRPRIVIVAPGMEILGGQGVQAQALLGALRADGWSADLVPINPPFPRGLGWLRRHRYVRTLVNEAVYVPSLRRLRDADVVHVFSASYWSFLLAPVPAIEAGRLMGKRVVLHYHSGEAADHLDRWGRLVHPWLRRPDEIVVPSRCLQAVFERHDYRARVIPNVVDTSSFRYRPRRPVRPRLLSTRNFEPHYRVENTLAAFAILRRSHPEATLTLAGYGRLESALRERAAALGATGIRFVGRVEPPDMPRLYDAADVFLNSSIVDNQPVSVLEAFAAGLPVVSTDTGDIGRMVRAGVNGVLVPPDDPSAMAAAAMELVEQPERALRLAEQARRDVQGYSWPAVRQAWADVYSGGASLERRAG
jgi:glycosyltransferase involved in cell wall biosynthesis